MRKNTALKILNPVLAILAVNQIVTVLFREKLSHESFEFFHQGGGMIFLGLVILHFVFNFNWVTANYFRKS
ncbi:MAG: hypothetical protein JW749_08250 [Sedimentisphaerales bacterium]|nr:hypothetical protein [Sedimentisphaerales bacterium]